MWHSVVMICSTMAAITFAMTPCYFNKEVTLSIFCMFFLFNCPPRSDHHHPVSRCESCEALQRLGEDLLRQRRRLLLHTWY